MTPPTWRKVRIVPGSQAERFSVRMFFTHLPVGDGAKSVLNRNLATENLPLETALTVGKVFEEAFVKLDESCRTMEERRKKP